MAFHEQQEKNGHKKGKAAFIPKSNDIFEQHF